jgi:uncharacterized protein
MIIDIERIPPEGLKISSEFEFLSAYLVDENAVFLEPVAAEIFIRRISEEIFVKGTIRTLLSFVCSRCLSPYEFPVDSSFDLVYLPEELDLIREQLENEDMNRSFYLSSQLSLDDIILEQLNLTFPIKTLCTDDCQGICPICGKVISEGQCHCATKESDPRLDQLKIFLRDKR